MTKTDTVIAGLEQAIEARDRFEAFLKTYEAALIKRIQTEPKRYRYGLDGVPAFIAKMREALPVDGYEIGDAMRDTCKTLGIKPNHKHIRAHLVGR